MENDTKYSILIVDDDMESIKVLKQILNDEGYKVRVAVNGKLAVESVKTRAPNIILMDIQMPEMDGYTACREIKKNEILKDIPIIFVTSMTVSFNKKLAFDAGGIDYITKPFQIDEVKARIRNHLTLSNALKKLEYQNKYLDMIVAEKTAELQNALMEKQVLIEELHHRINNNLQILLSLLYLHRKLFPDKALEDIMNDFTNHVSVLSIIHKKLYQSDNFLNINFSDFIDSLSDSFNTDNSQTIPTFIVNDSNFMININYAIPLGHLIYELIANSLKYNKNTVTTREIKIDLAFNNESGYEVKIFDNCHGISNHINYSQKNGPDYLVLSMFLEQLNASFECNYNDHTEFIIRFKKSTIKTYSDLKDIVNNIFT